MSSIIHDLQREILGGAKSAADLLRMAKVISVKLDLKDVAAWISSELNGYGIDDELPPYRKVAGGELQCYNPYHGWLKGHPIKGAFDIAQPISDIDTLSHAPSVVVPLGGDQKFSMQDSIGRDITHWQQQIVFDPIVMKAVVNAVRDRLLDWVLELEKRGITGEGMSFNENEKRLAHGQTYNIQNFTGIIGDVKNSSVQIFDYSSIHQTLKDHNVSQNERNQLEDLMDQLKTADPTTKKTLTQKAKDWLVRNEKVLGAAAGLVRHALGLEA